MTDEAKAARRAYQREWARKHPDRVKEHQQRYWAKKAAQQQAQQDEEPKDQQQQ
ncbi:MAG: phosphatase [Clostridiales bacterium]|nr:phosphatase [Clostridiales bacterium]